MREINYLSFGATTEIEILRQLEFCKVVSNVLDTKFNFYQFLFPDDEEWLFDEVIIIRLDQMNHFFESLDTRINDTLIVNHGFFYPYIKEYIGHEDGALIYHKNDIEYIFMKKIGLDPEDYNHHRKIEVALQSKCDWLYTSSEVLIRYMMDNDGYHEHKNSLIPSISFSGVHTKSNRRLKDDTSNRVNFVHIGPVSNRGIKYIKKVLAVEENCLVVVSDEAQNLLKQGFARNNRFQIVPFTAQNIEDQLSQSDYCLFRPKPNVSSYLRIEPFIYDCLRAGIKIIMPKDYNIEFIKMLGNDLLNLESCDFKLPELNLAQRNDIKNRYDAIINISSLENLIKFRNLKNIHERMVTK